MTDLLGLGKPGLPAAHHGKRFVSFVNIGLQLNLHKRFPVYLDGPVSSPAVANGAGCVPDGNESPAVSSQAQAHSAIDLFNSLPAPCPSFSAKTMVGHTHSHTPNDVTPSRTEEDFVCPSELIQNIPENCLFAICIFCILHTLQVWLIPSSLNLSLVTCRCSNRPNLLLVPTPPPPQPVPSFLPQSRVTASVPENLSLFLDPAPRTEEAQVKKLSKDSILSLYGSTPSLHASSMAPHGQPLPPPPVHAFSSG